MPNKNELLNPGSNMGGPIKHFSSKFFNYFTFLTFTSAVKFFFFPAKYRKSPFGLMNTKLQVLFFCRFEKMAG